MVSSLKEIVYIVCCACVLTGVYSILIPEGKMGSSVRLCLTLTLILAILSPLSGVKKSAVSYSIDTPTFNAADASTVFDQTLNESLRLATEKALQEKIEKNISVKKLYSSKGLDGNIYIVKVAIHYTGTQSAIVDRVKQLLGRNVQVELWEA